MADSQGVVLRICCQHAVSASSLSKKQIFCCGKNFEEKPKTKERWWWARHRGIAFLLEAKLISPLLLMSGQAFVNRSSPSCSGIERCFVLLSWTPYRLKTQRCDGKPPADSNTSRGRLVDIHPAEAVPCLCTRRALVRGSTPTERKRPAMRTESFYNPSQPM